MTSQAGVALWGCLVRMARRWVLDARSTFTAGVRIAGDNGVLNCLYVLSSNYLPPSKGEFMNHICPNCGSSTFSFRKILAASTPHGVTCASCGTLLRMPWWARLAPGVPLIAWIIWEIMARPPEIAELYGLHAAGVFAFLLIGVVLFFVPLEKVK